MDVSDHFHELSKKMKGIKDEDQFKSKKALKEKIDEKKKKAEEQKKKRKLENIVTLKNVNLKVKKGEFVCVVGKVGAGKSTLLSAIIGDLLPINQNQIDHFKGDQDMDKVLSA